MSTTPGSEDLKHHVRSTYGEIARGERDGFGPARGGSCGCSRDATSESEKLGYSAEELAALPEGADLGLGCGVPGRFAELERGEVVLDLGAGAGIDAFLAARHVGPEGHVIGVDMTPDMVWRRRGATRSPPDRPTWTSASGRSSTSRWPTARWT